jgi:hypothetical protein
MRPRNRSSSGYRKEMTVMAKRGSGRRDTVKQGTDTSYAERDGRGRFTERSQKGRSLAADRRTKAKKKVPSGKGHQGDRV